MPFSPKIILKSWAFRTTVVIMGNLRRLDEGTARLLRGTQTISSVRNIVKEAVENSLDAGATSVVVKLVSISQLV